MKIITMYELLGMVKDGKAPKRIIYDEYVYELNEGIENYEKEIDPLITLNWDYIVMNCLNEEVEILNKSLKEEKKIPEKLEDIIKDGCIEAPNNFILMDKINEIIDYLNYLKSKGE